MFGRQFRSVSCEDANTEKLGFSSEIPVSRMQGININVHSVPVRSRIEDIGDGTDQGVVLEVQHEPSQLTFLEIRQAPLHVPRGNGSSELILAQVANEGNPKEKWVR